MEKKIEDAIDKLMASFVGHGGRQDDASNNNNDNAVPFADGSKEEIRVVNRNGQQNTYKTFSYTYDGRLNWHVPKCFKFPARCKINLGWKLWLQGLLNNQILGPDGLLQAAPVRPFRKLNPAHLPEKVKKTFILHWKPIFELLEKAPSLSVVDNPTDIDATYIDKSFAKAKDYFKTRVDYVFQKKHAHPDSWEISTWSKHVMKSFILRHGMEQDKSHFPLAEQIIKT